MERKLILGQKEMAVEYVQATIVHSNKYNKGYGFYIFHFFFSSLVQEIVFKLKYTNKDCRFKLANSDIPAYVGQEVTLITIDYNVIGYVDNDSYHYYYLTNRFSDLFNIGNLSMRLILTLLLLIVVSYFYLPTHIKYLSIYIAFLIPFLYWIYQLGLNYFIKRKIDKVVQNSDI
jgi:hypothetical protein